jgi:hypothetical protein
MLSDMNPMLIPQIEPPQNADIYCRNYAPGVCMAQVEGVDVLNLTGEYHLREEVANLPILHFKNICDPDYSPIINKRSRPITCHPCLRPRMPWNRHPIFPNPIQSHFRILELNPDPLKRP